VEPHVDVITLAVGDLDRSLAFYRDGLGLETTGVVAGELVDQETSAAGAVVMFRLRGGLVLALYPRGELGDHLESAGRRERRAVTIAGGPSP
jgi:uncharacterized protein